ncbi:hypothetical protein FG05_30714, partial [Fusarium graminearum]
MTLCGAPIRNRQVEILAVNDVLGTTSGIFVLQRFATKLFYKLPWGLDDLFIGLSMLMAIPCMVINSGSINIALDVWILSIPLSQLKKMNLDWRKKIGVGIMFSVGIFVTIVSILRLSATIKMRAGVGANNATWEYTEFDQWSTIEVNVGIICACMPSLRVLLVRLFPTMLGNSTQQQYYKYGS